MGFRVAFVYFLLDTVPRLIAVLPGVSKLPVIDQFAWRLAVPWVVHHILHLSRDITVLGGQDTAYGYVVALCRLAAAIIAGAIWTLVGSRREYHTLHDWLRVLLRYQVASSMLVYGTAKVFQQQFPTPDLNVLIAPFGHLTPHTLLWNFMGFSRPYQIFTVSVECAGAILLFFRRTTTIGAFLIVAAMANVVVMDYSYQTFVKMIAVHLMLAAAFLTIPDLPDLARLLLLCRRVAPDVPARGSAAWRWVSVGTAAIAITYLTAVPSLQAWHSSEQLTRASAATPIYGLYRVERFVSNGQDIPADDPSRWSVMAIDGLAKDHSGFSIRLASERWKYYATEYDPNSSILMVIDGSRRSHLNYRRTLDGVELRGAFDGATVEITLRRIPEPPFALQDPHAVRWIASW